jgi:UDP-N-acetylmuramoyl-L-alanyl-D-glutamate--2,6-diaminopimelate ligase
MSRGMLLHDLLRDQTASLPSFNPLVRGLSSDSRELRAGDVFIALRGASVHGLAFAAKAEAADVAAILFEAPVPDGMAIPANAIAVPELRHKLGRLADRFYAAPSKQLAMTGVSGTNGKTSTVQLLAQALTLHGDRAGSIGTLGAGLHGELIAGERTTPDVIAVHRLIAQMRDAGATHVAMEVSSHALEQGRVDEIAFKVAVFTNLTRDHLDYHGTMAAYGAAKAKLFVWPTLEAVVINLDDAFGADLITQVADGVKRIGVSSRGHADAALTAENLALTPAGLRFELVEAGARHAVASSLLGRFNVDNLLAVAGALRALGWTLSAVAAMLPRLSPVGGRMSRVGGHDHAPLIVVDYAHTPDALEQALASLREHTPGRLTCVFGCGGDRDRGKRPQMAAIAERGADRVIVTDDNPRSEDGDAIVAEIVAGFADARTIRIERDRAKAIALALSDADAGDVILVAGKGHETYQEIAGVRYPFDDLAVARDLLERRA